MLLVRMYIILPNIELRLSPLAGCYCHHVVLRVYTDLVRRAYDWATLAALVRILYKYKLYYVLPIFARTLLSVPVPTRNLFGVLEVGQSRLWPL